MNKTFLTIRYLIKDFSKVIGVGFFVILTSVAVTDLVYYLTDRLHSTDHQSVSLTVPFEFTAGIFAILIGLVLLLLNFKVMIANGVSRKTFLLANLPAAGLAAAAFAIFNWLVVLVHNLFWRINLISDLVYGPLNWPVTLMIQFALYFMLIGLGWFIALTAYRSSTPVKWAIAAAPFVLYSLLQIAKYRIDAAVYNAVGDYIKLSMGTPASAVVTMLGYALILCGLVYLLIRRAPLKD